MGFKKKGEDLEWLTQYNVEQKNDVNCSLLDFGNAER